MSSKNELFTRKKALFSLILLVVALALAACGDTPANTPVPASTTTVAASAPTGNAGTSPAPGNNGGTGGPRQGNFNPPVTGTVDSFDTASNMLTVKESNGQSEQFEVANARVTKTEKITSDQLSNVLGNNAVVQVTGQKAADGSYDATRITVMDRNAFGGPGGRGPGQGQGQGQGQNFTPPANFTPGAGGRFGNGQGNGGVIVQNPTVSGNKITGTDFNGNAITINLSSTTVINQRAAGALTDLKSGETVSVTFRAAQGGTAATAVAVTIEEQP